MAALTGMRRHEILALRLVDLGDNTLTISRSLEETKGNRRVKEPKTARGNRTIAIDGTLAGLLSAQRRKVLCLIAGIPEAGDSVDLSLVRVPEGTLLFPAPALAGRSFDPARPRDARSITRTFMQRAAVLGFEGLRFHDLRGSHETVLLDNGVPVHVVAARCGHDPATLLRVYAKRTKKADTSAAAIIGTLLSKGLRG
jgi:integrase